MFMALFCVDPLNEDHPTLPSLKRLHSDGLFPDQQPPLQLLFAQLPSPSDPPRISIFRRSFKGSGFKRKSLLPQLGTLVQRDSMRNAFSRNSFSRYHRAIHCSATISIDSQATRRISVFGCSCARKSTSSNSTRSFVRQPLCRIHERVRKPGAHAASNQSSR